MPQGLFFGAFVGLLMGGLVGLACCWICDLQEFVWLGILAGVLVGSLVGALLGKAERRIRGELVRPDIATIIGVLYGIVPSLALLLGIGEVRGLRSGLLWLGLVFVGPAVGLLIGAILDRAYEASRNNSWLWAVGFGLTGLAAAVGAALLITKLMQGPDPRELAREVWPALLKAWQWQPELKNAAIRKINLVHVGGREYSGLVDTEIGERALKFRLKVVVYARTLDLEWKRIDERDLTINISSGH
ncbi:MAG: hypothetical protein L0215_14945 [Gemmataceae bacterium]|nr:hypothetical protein [Gemmataceae bacterium]